MKFLTLISLMLLVVGCSTKVPIAVNAPISTQQKAKSTHHWDILANDVASETCALLEREPKKGGALQGKPFYVVPPQGGASFDKAFRDLLITRMVSRGMPVTNQRTGGIQVQYETQVVRHGSAGYAHVPGTLTALSAGVWVVRELVAGSVAAIPGALGLAALADWGAGKYAGGPTPTELIVTTSIALDDRYLFRKSNIYYIDTEDTELYWDGADRVRQLEVVGR